MEATSIDHVLELLDQTIGWSRETGNRNGYFAALYRDVTTRIREACTAGVFEDPARMRRLDVVFANRYLTALDQWHTGQSPTRSWARSFAAADRWRPLVIQHLLLGINAHINLDLGIAAAAVAPNDQIVDLKSDFFRVNEILGEMIEAVQMRIVHVSPWTGALDRLGGRADEVISNFCLQRARDDAWAFARTLAHRPIEDHPRLIQQKDDETARRIRKILQPGGPWLLPVLFLIRLGESRRPAAIIEALSMTSPQARSSFV